MGAISHQAISDAALVPKGHQQINDVSAAVGLTVPSGADRALIQVLDQNVRWRDDGTNPSATVGIQIAAGDPPFFYTGSLAAIKFLEEAGGAEINVAYYGPS